MTGCCRTHLAVARALSRDQVMASPTLITPSFFSTLSFSFSHFIFCSLLLISIFSFHNGHISAFPNNLFPSTSQVILTDTSVSPLPFSSRRQSLDMHHSFQVMSLVIDLRITGTTDQRLPEFVNFYKSSRKDHHIFKCGQIFT